MLARVRRATWRLEQAERERLWALVAARAEGVSVRKASEAVGLSPPRVHQLTQDVAVDVLDAGLGELWAAGWPAPEDLNAGGDAEPARRAVAAGRLDPPVRAVGRTPSVGEFSAGGEPAARSRFSRPARGGRGSGEGGGRAARVAFDVEELVRVRAVEDLDTARVRDEPRAERRRRPAEPDLGYAEFCARTRTPTQSIRQGADAWTTYQAERHRRGETDENPYTAYNPFRPGRG
ncbi:hypothetical protein [Streptomyces vietnamensis]|uniref:hypothetical protein n=1 Tax=Streptomyces vietnamensis TaxID=362257 RepID=UPI00131E8F9A|nr:hypothetical protein [Streptomyces vietnamensis]